MYNLVLSDKGWPPALAHDRPPWRAVDARHCARGGSRGYLGEVVKGDDPGGAKREARKAATIADLCTAYLEAAECGRILTRRKAAKKPSTLATDKGRIERHIKPFRAPSEGFGSHARRHRAVSRRGNRWRDEGADQDRQARAGACNWWARNRDADSGLARRNFNVRRTARAADR